MWWWDGGLSRGNRHNVKSFWWGDGISAPAPLKQLKFNFLHFCTCYVWWIVAREVVKAHIRPTWAGWHSFVRQFSFNYTYFMYANKLTTTKINILPFFPPPSARSSTSQHSYVVHVVLSFFISCVTLSSSKFPFFLFYSFLSCSTEQQRQRGKFWLTLLFHSLTFLYFTLASQLSADWTRQVSGVDILMWWRARLWNRVVWRGEKSDDNANKKAKRKFP